jgi:hypothetical protein
VISTSTLHVEVRTVKVIAYAILQSVYVEGLGTAPRLLRISRALYKTGGDDDASRRMGRAEVLLARLLPEDATLRA